MKLALLWLMASSTLGAQSSPQGEVTTIILPEGIQVARIWHQDLSGDGRADLVIAARKQGVSYARFLRIYYDRGADAKTPFGQEPDRIIDLPRSISACAIGDVQADQGSELIWFGARGVYVFRPEAGPEGSVTKIVASEFLYQFPEADDVLSWQDGVRDLDGDGLVDLLLPEPGGFRIAIQRRHPDGRCEFDSTLLELPAGLPSARDDEPLHIRAKRNARQFEIGLQIMATGEARPPLVSVSEEVPAPQLQDWDADGDLDLIAKRDQHVYVWLQTAAGEFDPKPATDLAFPLSAGQTELDPSYGAWISDLNGDRRADAMLLTKDRNSEDLRSQILFFSHDPESDAPLFHAGRPQQLLLLAGLALAPKLVDIDGDGFPDLRVGSWRLDALDQLTAGEHRSLDGEFYVYLNRQGRFSRRPDLTHKVTLNGNQLTDSGTLQFEFFADLNGDGIRDLLLREDPEEVKLQLVVRRAGKLSIVQRPVWRMQIHKKAKLMTLPTGSERPGFLVREPDRVLLVRF